MKELNSTSVGTPDEATVDEHVLLIGLMAVRMTQLEDHVRHFIGELISDDFELGIRITAGEQYADLVILLNSLFRYRISDDKILKRFKALHKHLEDRNTERNNNVHAVWMLPKDNAPIKSLKFKKKHTNGLKVEYKDSSNENIFQSLKDFLSAVDFTIEELMHVQAISKPLYLAHRTETAQRHHIMWNPKTGLAIRPQDETNEKAKPRTKT